MNTDITWLPNHLLKDIDLPKVITEENIGQNYGGYYTQGTKNITIVYSDIIASTITHEFCHYLQNIQGRSIKSSKWEIKGTYEESIKNYFKNSINEYEALLFEYKYAKDYLNEWWLRKLVME